MTAEEIDFQHRAHHPLWVLLQTRHPCCNTRATFRALKEIPREVYARICPRCGRKWTVERRTAAEGTAKRIDVLE